jgi:hypothetical protein
MTSREPDRLVKAYLKRLRAASRRLPRKERAELRAQIEDHVRDALPEDASEAAVRTVLERLGEPDVIVAEQRTRLDLPAQEVGRPERITILFLLFGGFLIGVGWLVGAVRLWSSRAWTTREKLIGTVLVPGGLAMVALIASLAIEPGGTCLPVRLPGHAVARHCTGGASTLHNAVLAALLIVLVVIPLSTSVFLARHARSHAA